MTELPVCRLAPGGWSDFAAHVREPEVRPEFSTETGEDGKPLWERPIDIHHDDQETSP